MTGQRVLVTGAAGFVGRALCERLSEEGCAVQGVVRSLSGGSKASGINIVRDVGPSTEWRDLLDGVDVVVHLAARAHVIREKDEAPVEAFRRVNSLGSAQLATACRSSGVRRIVYVSSIGVHGALSGQSPFTEASACRPESPYAQSKLEGEEAIQSNAGSDLQYTIVRPPLVHGPAVKGNFLRLLRWVDRGIPLPLGSVHNVRSFVGVSNLTSLLTLCCFEPAAANEVFVVSDGEDISTTDLLRTIASKLARAPRLLPFPPAVIRALAGAVGRSEDAERLLGTLQVNSEKVRRVLTWEPQQTLEEGLESMCGWYRSHG